MWLGCRFRALVVGELALINRKLERIMATQEEFDAAFARIDAATTSIAAIIRDLQGQIGSGMTEEQENAVKARLDLVASSLEQMATGGVENPVPMEPPAEPTA